MEGDRTSSVEAVVAASRIDVFIPPLYRPTYGPGSDLVAAAVTIDYDAPTQRGEAALSCTPYVWRHRTEEAVGAGDGLFTLPSTQWRSEEPKGNVKQGLMEVLLGDSTTGKQLMSDAGRPLPAPSIAEEVQARLRGTRCDATHVTAPQLLVALLRVILASRTDAARALVDCVTSIDISHTQLGCVGEGGPPLHFDESGAPMPPPPGTAATHFFPDERPRRGRAPDAVASAVAQRSLALAYVAPLLFVPGLRLYRIRELICTHCALTDADAHALALILRTGDGQRSHRGPRAFFRRAADTGRQTTCCTLETLDVSYNRITDVGMTELKHTIKHNRHLHTMTFTGNDVRNRHRLVKGIERRLKRNREGTTGHPLLRLQRWGRKKVQ